MTWKMAVVTNLVTGKEGLVWAATLCTANGTTNGPITKLYPLELNKTETLTDVGTEEEHCPTDSMESLESTVNRPQRKSAQRATVKMKEWARVLAAPRRMLQRQNSNNIFIVVYVCMHHVCVVMMNCGSYSLVCVRLPCESVSLLPLPIRQRTGLFFTCHGINFGAVTHNTSTTATTSVWPRMSLE